MCAHPWAGATRWCAPQKTAHRCRTRRDGCGVSAVRLVLTRDQEGISGVTIFRWILAPASVLATVSVVVFIVADVEQMSTLRAVAAGALAFALLVTLGAALIALYVRKRD